MKTLNIGRNPMNDIILNDKTVSRQHAQLIILDNGQIIIKDMGSSNGTFVNGNRITESNLNPGDIVKCGNSFLKWDQYVYDTPKSSSSAHNQAFAQEGVYRAKPESDADEASDQIFSLGKVFQYLATQILDTGEIFRNTWNMTSSILFFFLTPLVIVLIAGIIFYSKFSIDFTYQVILPFTLAIFLFGAAQFLSILLLTINRGTTMIKIALASGIFSFIQFIMLLVSFLVFIPILNNDHLFDRLIFGPELWYIFLYVAILTIHIVLFITLVVFLFKYFRESGISKSISIHFTVFAFMINLALQFIFIYLFLLITYNSITDLI